MVNIMEPDTYEDKFEQMMYDVRSSYEEWGSSFHMHQEAYDQYMAIAEEFMKENNISGYFSKPISKEKSVDTVVFTDSFDFFHQFFVNQHEAQREQMLDDVKTLQMKRSTAFWDKQYNIVRKMLDDGRSYKDTTNRIITVCKMTQLDHGYKG